jgi:hypothetical protein
MTFCTRAFHVVRMRTHSQDLFVAGVHKGFLAQPV